MSSATGIVFDRRLFFRNLAGGIHRVLLTNYDGVLAPLSVDRQHAFPYPTVPELLDSILTTCNTRLVLLTSKSARELASILGLNPRPEIWGCTGYERLLPDGGHQRFALDDSLNCAIDDAHQWLEYEGLGALVQRKANGIAVRWHHLPVDTAADAAAAARRTLWPFERCHPQLHVHRVEGGLELRALTRDSSDVVRHIMAELPSDAVVAYVGNCTTEEGAFRTIVDRGLGVLVCPQYRPTAAQLWLQPPEDVTVFLTDWISACGGVL